jgi:hypothetical protein
MPSAFDPPPGVMKGNGQMSPTGGGSYQAPQQGAPQPVVAPPAGPQGPTPTTPAPDPGAIYSLISALAKAFAPKSVTQQGKKIEQGIAEGEGNDSLGKQLSP